MNTELIITLGLLVFEIIIFVLCYLRMKQPPNPMRPRLLPYGLISIFLILGILLTVAHTVSVMTGHRLEGRTKMKGQR